MNNKNTTPNFSCVSLSEDSLPIKSNRHIQLRTVFMGTPDFAREILAGLLQAEYNIVAVYAQPDKKSGREQAENACSVKKLALEKNLTVFQPQKFDAVAVAELQKLKPDLIIVAAYGKILPKAVLDLPGFGCINVHASLLPKFRGPSPVQNAILQGEKETGITLMLMDEGIDTGKIISASQTSIGAKETAADLLSKLSILGTEELLKIIPAWIERHLEAKEQDHKLATLCQLIEREDGHIMWNEESEKIYNRFRALFPWPGIFSYFEDKGSLKRLKILKISFHAEKTEIQYIPGEVFLVGEKVGVQAQKGFIFLEEVQPEGKNPMKIKDFINGYPDFIGSFLK